MIRLQPGICTPVVDEVRQLLSQEDTPSVFQTPEIAQVYKRTKGCRVTSLGVTSGTGRLVASLQSIIFQNGPAAHASIRGGPVCSSESDKGEAARALLAAHESRVRMRTLYTRIYPSCPEDVSFHVARECGFVQSSWLNILIPLIDLGTQWKKVSKARKKGIQHAQRSAIKLRDVTSNADLEAMLRLLLLSARHGRYPLQNASLFEAVHDCLVPLGLARMVLAEVDGEAVAARIVLTYRGVMSDWYAGSDPARRETHGDEWLVWELLCWGHDRGYRLFDFGGAGVAGISYGPREFKRRFGGEETDVGRLTREHFPRTMKVADTLFRLYQGGAKS